MQCITGMRGVVISGKDSSVSSIFQGMKVKLAGKTGTAQENKNVRIMRCLSLMDHMIVRDHKYQTVVIRLDMVSSNAAATAKDIYESIILQNDKTKKTLEKNKSVSRNQCWYCRRQEKEERNCMNQPVCSRETVWDLPWC